MEKVFYKLRELYGKVEQYVRKLQREDEALKRRWLVLGTVVAMVVVVVLWVGYLRLTLPSVATTGAGEEVAAAYGEESLFSTLKRGLGVIGSWARDIISGAAEKIRNSDYTFEVTK